VGIRGACIVVSEEAWNRADNLDLGAWLVDSAPRGTPLPNISRKSGRDVPFTEHSRQRRVR
jgi:hypothetical protein